MLGRLNCPSVYTLVLCTFTPTAACGDDWLNGGSKSLIGFQHFSPLSETAYSITNHISLMMEISFGKMSQILMLNQCSNPKLFTILAHYSQQFYEKLHIYHVL